MSVYRKEVPHFQRGREKHAHVSKILHLIQIVANAQPALLDHNVSHAPVDQEYHSVTCMENVVMVLQARVHAPVMLT